MAIAGRADLEGGDAEALLLDALRASFARDDASLREQLLAAAFAAGMAWDRVALAAAEGMAKHPRWTMPAAAPAACPSTASAHVSQRAEHGHDLAPAEQPARRALSLCRRAPLLLASGGAFALLYPALQFAHEALTLLVAAALSAIGHVAAAWDLVHRLPFDPVYSDMALQSLTRIEPLGLALRGALGDWLHAALPILFLPSEQAGAALVAAVFAAGNPLLALGLSRFSVDLTLFAFGLWLAARGRATRFFGLLVVLDVSLRMVRFPPTIGDLEAAGASFITYALAPGLTRRQVALSDLTSAYPEALLALALGLTILVLAILSLLSLALAWRLSRWLIRRPPLARAGGWRPGRSLVALAVLGLPLAALPQSWAWPAPAAPGPAASAASAAPAVVAEQPLQLAGALASAIAPVVQAPASRPSVVRVAGGPRPFVYSVNGERKVVRGMGYNPMYSQKPADERLALYERDFALMRDAHVNTVAGWDNLEFDGVLLDAAQRQGLGVLMPYPLSPDADYADEAVRDSLRDELLAWVARYREHPAVRMWGISNEVLHKLIHPSWMNAKNDPDKERRANAFAEFFVSIADEVHALDPNHPVIIREAEEAYVGPTRRALEKRPASRPWLIWGVNIYNPRLAKLLEWWREKGPPHALLVSEFAEGGVSPADRPRGYRKLWNLLREQPTFTIGGVPYVWYTNGPEEVDRAFGLVGLDGVPVGGSLAEIRQMYLEDQQRTAAATET